MTCGVRILQIDLDSNIDTNWANPCRIRSSASDWRAEAGAMVHMELWIAIFVFLMGSCSQGKATVEHSKLASYIY